MRAILSLAVCLLALVSNLAAAQPGNDEEARTAVFAAGCFWCVEQAFDQVDGVLETISGYAGGTVPNPSYRQVTDGGTGHAEAVKLTYDPEKVRYADLLSVYWANVDPVDAEGQFCDRGASYRPVIFAQSDRQKQLAEASKAAVAELLKAPVAVAVQADTTFFKAEAYHQNYYEKNPLRYRYYKWRCGREQRLSALWGDRDRIALPPLSPAGP